MSLYLFLCYTQGNVMVNCNKWRIVFIDGYPYNCLPDRWVMQVRILAFSCKHFLSVCMFIYKCHFMLVSVNTVDSTFSFILHGARVQGNCYLLPLGQLSRSPTTSDMDNNSMSILLDVNLYMHETWCTVASSPGHSQILSRSHGEKLGEGLGTLLRRGPEMVDLASAN